MNHIKQVLIEKGIKQTWLFEKSGKSYAIISDYTTNRREPRLETFYKVAEILQVDIKDLIVSNPKKK